MTRITHVLCPVDFSEASRAALEHAAALARWYEARLTVLHVLFDRPNMDLPPLAFDDADRERLMTKLREFMPRLAAPMVPVLRIEAAPSIAGEIVAQAAATQADLLVLGTHGRSALPRLFLGSVTEKVMRAAVCPTLIVRPRVDPAGDVSVPFRRILCPVDFSESSLAALGYAIELAEEADAHLALLHVVELPGLQFARESIAFDVDLAHVHKAAAAEARRRLDGLVPTQARTYCTVETAVDEGRPQAAIVRDAIERQADLIVMGTHGRGGGAGAGFGSTAYHVIRAAPCPVLVIRGTLAGN